MTSWSLEGELRSLLAVDGDLTPALRRVGLLQAGWDRYELREIEAWHPGGAETYVYVFDLVAGAAIRRLIIKAFVSAAAGAGRLDVLLERRALLESEGIAVPEMYASGRGVLLEEYVPWLLRDYVRSTPPDDRAARILVGLNRLALVLDAYGFAPLSPFADLRTDGSRVFMVDFGEDLGGPHMRSKGEPVVQQVGPWVRSLGWRLSDTVLEDALSQARQPPAATQRRVLGTR